MLNNLLFVTSVVVFWVSMSLTEGWNWRMMFNKPDTNRLITNPSYHVYRLLTNLSFFTSIIFFNHNSENSLNLLISANLFGWALYGRFMRYVDCDSFFAQASNFKILGYEFKRFPISFQITFLVLSYVYLVFSLFL